MCQMLNMPLIFNSEFEELSAAHLLLKRLVERHEIPVLNDIVEAIHWISNVSLFFF